LIALETEILQAMLGHANPLFMIGLLAMYERDPETIKDALNNASNTYYLALEKQHCAYDPTFAGFKQRMESNLK
jgi:hypothetical protein